MSAYSKLRAEFCKELANEIFFNFFLIFFLLVIRAFKGIKTNSYIFLF